jgi:glycosyltransferase involved in cell wall biosynthesis
MTNPPTNTTRPLDILVLVPHEPGLDPRIHYTTTAMAKHHRVTVLATVLPRQSRAKGERVEEVGYEVTRLKCPLLPRPGTLFQFLRMAVRAPSPPRKPEAPSQPSGDAKPLPVWKRIKANLIYLLLTGSVNHTLQRYLRAHQANHDIIFCHDLYTLQTGVMLKRKTGVRLAYDSHEYYPFQFTHTSFVRSTLWYERKLVPHVDLYTTISPELAGELENVFGMPKVEVIPNVEPSPATAIRPLGAEMDRLAAGRRKLLYQGNFVEGRGLVEMIQEWATVDHTRAALFLRGPENRSQADLKALAGKMGLLGSSIYFLPPVLEKDLIPAAAEADIGIIPYKADLPAYRFACPNKLSQYMHAGVAVLTNDIPFVAGMVRSHGLGWVYDIRQPGSFAKTVAATLDDRALTESRAKASAIAQTTYRWETYEARLVGLIERMMSPEDVS